jgi:hypothetical protein
MRDSDIPAPPTAARTVRIGGIVPSSERMRQRPNYEST